ncbi:hypothetical protein ERX46_13045 [Brumimicrobium glaciale]|jgi:hypothetical protein|uniref:Uncharacterized protein n=1 Tax=Brumimicrobium glaciale TaxID=200475 RepID=A0A4Q4KIC5_9FLAO|nr:hypothetical protein [Brumimicrobium glaciale]RYM32972.1 hypothetical protein ERX46_13045 [Brumimicrobium glaciale]
MKITLKVLFVMKGFVIAGLVIWGVFLAKSKTELQLENYELTERYNYLEAFNEILQYDLETSRDSVRILEKRIDDY